jgi:8-oxo-dGTP pyrophosphatase MutT (NUDIX family)
MLGLKTASQREIRMPRGRICAAEVRLTQVAAVCYRCKSGLTQFLLVRTTSGRWTFPKGHRENGFSDAQVAALEAFEEGGVHGEVDPRPIGRYLHRKESLRRPRSKEVIVLAFLLEVKTAALPAEAYRAPRWFTPSEAKRRLIQGRPRKYFRSVERVVDSALVKIARRRPPDRDRRLLAQSCRTGQISM